MEGHDKGREEKGREGKGRERKGTQGKEGDWKFWRTTGDCHSWGRKKPENSLMRGIVT